MFLLLQKLVLEYLG